MPKPFKVFNCWYDQYEFTDFGKIEWKSYSAFGKKYYVIREKFKHLKERLKWWNKLVFGWLD